MITCVRLLGQGDGSTVGWRGRGLGVMHESLAATSTLAGTRTTWREIKQLLHSFTACLYVRTCAAR